MIRLRGYDDSYAKRRTVTGVTRLRSLYRLVGKLSTDYFLHSLPAECNQRNASNDTSSSVTDHRNRSNGAAAVAAPTCAVRSLTAPALLRPCQAWPALTRQLIARTTVRISSSLTAMGLCFGCGLAQTARTGHLGSVWEGSTVSDCKH